MDGLIGLDISKDWFDGSVCLGFSCAELSIPRLPNSKSGFQSLLKQARAVGITNLFVCMEATGSYWKEVALYLYDARVTVYVVNPARIKAQRRMEQKRSKTDKIDSALILRFLKSQLKELRPWSPPRESVEHLQSLVRFRELLVGDRTRMKNLLHSKPASPSVKTLAQRRIEEADEAIKEIDQEIELLIQTDEQLSAQCVSANSVPSIGPVTAAALLAECRAFSEISSPRQCTAFAGLDVITETSGSSIRAQPRISKQGSRLLRTAFYRAAVSAIKSRRGPFRSFYQKLLAKGLKKKQALTATARKLLEITTAVVLSGASFDTTRYVSEA
jgi:transposase